MLKTGNEFSAFSWEREISNAKVRGTARITLPWMRDGAQSPFYKQLIQDNKDATTPLNASRASVVSLNQGHMTGVYRFNKSKVLNTHMGNEYPTLGTELSVSNILTQKAQAQARSYAFDKINRLQDPFSLGVFGGELRETIKLLRHPLENAVKLTKDYHIYASRKAAKARGKNYAANVKLDERVIKDISDSWLQYRFGILPLISDMNALLTLASDQALDELRVKNRCYGSAEQSATTVTTNSTIGTNCLARKEENTIYRAECFIHFGVLYDRLNRAEEFSGRVMDSFDSIEELTITAWELIPFSFLVDYFVNVGDVLSSALSTSSVLSYSSESTVKTIITQNSFSAVRSAQSGIDSVDNIVVNSLPHITVQNRYVKRLGGILAIPPITFTMPGSNIQYMNIAALIASLNLRRS